MNFSTLLLDSDGQNLNHNQTVVSTAPFIDPQHNQTVVQTAPTVWPQHNQTLVQTVR